VEPGIMAKVRYVPYVRRQGSRRRRYRHPIIRTNIDAAARKHEPKAPKKTASRARVDITSAERGAAERHNAAIRLAGRDTRPKAAGISTRNCATRRQPRQRQARPLTQSNAQTQPIGRPP